MKKHLSILLCVILLLCAGCRPHSTPATEPPTTTPPTQVPTEEPSQPPTEPQWDGVITIGIPKVAGVTDYENNAYTLWLEAQTGYDLQFVSFESSPADYKTQLATLIINSMGGGEKLPDILLGFSALDNDFNPVWSIYGMDGYFMDLTEYITDKDCKAKNWWERASALDPEYVQLLIKRSTAMDGRIYALPTVQESRIASIQSMGLINREWLQKLNLEMPTDPDSLYNVLVAFRDRDPNGNGKKDEIPLLGTTTADQYGSTDVVNWIVNQFLYFDQSAMFALDADSKTVTTPFTSDQYRKAIIFCRKLVDEGLLYSNKYHNISYDEVASMMSPSDGVAKVGICIGNPRAVFKESCDLVYEYAALTYSGHTVFRESANTRDVFITRDAGNPDACWNLLMLMSTEESALRQRYGEKGVDWDWADDGAVSGFGDPARIKLLGPEVYGTENNRCWNGMYATILTDASSERIQLKLNASMREQALDLMLRNILNTAEEKRYTGEILPPIYYTKEQYRLTEETRKYVTQLHTAYQSAFVHDTDYVDPSIDSHWGEYLTGLENCGLSSWLQQVQQLYEEYAQ